MYELLKIGVNMDLEASKGTGRIKSSCLIQVRAITSPQIRRRVLTLLLYRHAASDKITRGLAV